VADKNTLLAALWPHWQPEHGADPIWIGCEDGWLPLIEELHRRIVAIAPSYGLREVFQKYGLLIYRVGAVDESLEAAVRACLADVRQRSSTVCEFCGDTGRLCRDPGGWRVVVCPRHEALGGHVPCPGESYTE
jgi:hypothetical protein